MSHDHKDEELYRELLKETKQTMNEEQSFSEEGQERIVRIGKNTARITNVMISLALILLIIPIMTLASHLYYAVGNKANTLIEVVGNTIYVTEPNVSIEEMEIEEKVGIFTLNLDFDLYKKIGNEEYNVGEESIRFNLDSARFPEKRLLLERPLPEIPSVENEVLFHPEATINYDSNKEWDKLKGLPDGTMSEVYVSLTDVMTKAELETLLPEQAELRWVAVDTGLEAKQLGESGVPITSLGFPAQIDHSTWSPFNGREGTNEEVFLRILKLLEKHEQVATKVARAKELSLSKRIEYIQKHGINVYGAVITGPTEEIRKLQSMKEIRAVKLGEVKLWN
ncbi:anti-sigma factor [Bacillus sp. JJ722]|uniref:anti-sigma factor n=1 Tax=Bacillus sp. JJ722 TaxID=3122973 RepID=UPI002FFDCE44